MRPEGKIPRAEVATIYFRMLTDESRTKFWSQSSGYSDVKTGDWFNNAVSTLSNAGIIAGYEDGSFRPNGYITRAEFATIAARFFDVTYSGKDLFPDISGHWAKDYINQAANKGFVNGYEDGSFRPENPITREEFAVLLYRMSGSPAVEAGDAVKACKDFDQVSLFARDAMTWAVENQIIRGYLDSTVQPLNSITRAELATMILRYYRQFVEQ